MTTSHITMANSSSITIRRLEAPTETEIKQVVEVLRVAFDNGDPFLDFISGGDKSLVPQKFETNVRAAAVGGEIHVASIGPEVEDIVGVGVWYGPGQESMATEQQRAAGWNQLAAKMPEELRTWWFEYFIPTMGRLSDESVGPRFKLSQWHLLLFGVLPEYHRRGIARTLMTFVEEQAKAEGVSILLETTTDLDVTIYKRMGFHTKGQTTVKSPLGECQVYQMMKTP